MPFSRSGSISRHHGATNKLCIPARIPPKESHAGKRSLGFKPSETTPGADRLRMAFEQIREIRFGEGSRQPGARLAADAPPSASMLLSPPLPTPYIAYPPLNPRSEAGLPHAECELARHGRQPACQPRQSPCGGAPQHPKSSTKSFAPCRPRLRAKSLVYPPRRRTIDFGTGLFRFRSSGMFFKRTAREPMGAVQLPQPPQAPFFVPFVSCASFSSLFHRKRRAICIYERV